MTFFRKILLLVFSGAVLAAPAAHADDLEKMLNSRRQVLNQFESGSSNSAAPSAAARTAPSPAQPARAVARVSADEYRTASGGSADELIGSAMGLLGVAYRYGGTSARTGFDCSGFMQHIFRRSMGISLPRTSAAQAQMGVGISRSELQPGDMVFFRTAGRRISHVGLYIGNNRFIHAPRTGKRIEITSLSNKYWNARYALARRVKKNDPSRFLN